MSVGDVLEGRSRWHVKRGGAFELLRGLPDESVDIVATDPPYCSGGRSTAERKAPPSKKYVQTQQRHVAPEFLGDGRDQRSFIRWCSIWMEEAWRVTKDDGLLLVFSDWRQAPAVSDAVQAAGWIWRGTIVWEKPQARPLRGGFNAQCEYVIWATKESLAKRYKYGTRPGHFRVGHDRAEKVHMTGKPRVLMRELLKGGPPDGLIVDPFTGGGTTGAAALDLGYRFLGAELSPTYARLASSWLEEVD